MAEVELGPGGTGCPVPGCRWCPSDGDCEDCLDCLYGPGVEDQVPTHLDRPVVAWHHLPLPVAALAKARGELRAGDLVALLLRAARGDIGVSQREMAARLGVAKSTLARVETAAGRMTLDQADTLLRSLGHSLWVLDREGEPVSTRVWGTSELLLRDHAGRRHPAHATVRVDRADDGGAETHAWRP